MAHSREPQLLAAQLDSSLLRLSDLDKAFLREEMSVDETEREKRMIGIQKMCVPIDCRHRCVLSADYICAIIVHSKPLE